LKNWSEKDKWIGIMGAYQDINEINNMLRHCVKHLVLHEVDTFTSIFGKYKANPPLQAHQVTTEMREGQNWFWKLYSNEIFISKEILDLLLRKFFLASDIFGQDAKESKALPQDTTESMLNKWKRSVASTKWIPASLLGLILNRYCKLLKGKLDKPKFVYYNFPIFFEKETASAIPYYRFSVRKELFVIECTLAYNFFVSIFPADTACPFETPADPSAVRSLPFGSSWNADEWFEKELTPADSWFASIASTLSASARGAPGSP
jgi:hypothetical protein